MVRFTRWRKLEGWRDPTFRGTAIESTEQVKHLGVILDAKLNWGKHMQRVRDRACALLWATRRACGVTWGLNPQAMHWIYTAVVRPAVLFGAVVWWSRTRLKTARGMLTHVQRLASRGTTSAMKTAPSMALETLMNWPPLYTAVQGAAASSAYRLMSTNQWQGELERGSHTDIVGVLRKASPLAFLTRDRDLVGHRFNNTYKVAYPGREEWETESGPLRGQELIWYTDGSKMEAGSGAGLCLDGSRREMHIPLGKHSTVFQAEITAIQACVLENRAAGYRGKRICICSDSQAALKALERVKINSRLVRDCRDALQDLADLNRVTLIWVPGHKGIAGNERADKLARKGSETPLLGPEPAIGITGCQVKAEIAGWVEGQHRILFRATPGMRQTKALIDGPDVKITDQLLRLSRQDLRVAVGVLTGHCTLRKHMHTLGKVGDSGCRRCGGDEETPIHVLCDCPALAGKRQKHLGAPLWEPREITTLPMGVLVAFMRDSGLL